MFYRLPLKCHKLEATLKAIDLKSASSHHFYFSVLDYSDYRRLYLFKLNLLSIIDSLLVNALSDLFSDFSDCSGASCSE